MYIYNIYNIYIYIYVCVYVYNHASVHINIHLYTILVNTHTLSRPYLISELWPGAVLQQLLHSARESIHTCQQQGCLAVVILARRARTRQ